MQFIYVGRLDEEKGINSLLYCIQSLINTPNIHFHIYGKGTYTDQIQQLAQQHPQLLSYHGRQKKEDISTQRSECDFFVMPSTFLETFGLTACESLLLGVPVIGNKRGGLLPFIPDTLDLQQQPGQNDGEKLLNLIRRLLSHQSTKQEYQQLIEQIRQDYTTEQRYKTYQHYTGTSNNIIMISDFINYNGGGIETNIHDSKDIITQHHRTVSLYGHQAPTGKRARAKKLWIMGRSIANIYDTIAIVNRIKKQNIGLIRRHSISRVIGRLPLCIVGYTTPESKQCMTHHELGLFHPYPSKVTSETQLPKARSRKAFVKAGNANSFITQLSILGKYILIWLIHKQLQKHIDTHIVPSSWMIPIVKRRHPHAQVVCIPHFVSINQ